MPIKKILPVVILPLILLCTENPVLQDIPVTQHWEWPGSSLSAEGIDTAVFNRGLGYIHDSVKTINSIAVVRNGKFLFQEQYQLPNADTTYYLASSTKSITGVLMGIAIKNGIIKDGVLAKVLDFFPDMTFKNTDDRKRRMTIEDLLTHRTGLYWDDNVDYDSMIASGNPVQYTLDLPMDTTPGSRWRYSTGASHILSVIIARAAGQPTLDFARENLFNPLDIETFTWEKDPQGNVYGGSTLSLKPRDLAKVGQLMLDSGMWNGKEIVPAAWVKASTDTLVKTAWVDNGRYGYQWWIVKDLKAFCSRGYAGQDMYVVPEKKLIVVFNSALPSESASKALNRLMKNQILPAVMD